MITEKSFVKNTLPCISEDANKYTKGSLMCFAGSYGMAGAAVLAAKSAYRSGAGIVRLVIADSVYPICAAALSEAVYTPLESGDGKLPKDAFDKTKEFLKKSSAVVFGCGTGKSAGVRTTLIKLLKENTSPLLIDADGINTLSEHIDALRDKACPVVLTPHEGEMSRLIGKDSEYVRVNRVAIASEFAENYGVTLLLKGKDTVIADENGKIFINPTGNAGLATAGSGDVLTGVIGAFLGQGVAPFNAAVAGAYIHGLSGDIAAKDLGIRSLMATDIIEYLPRAFKEC